MHRRPSQGHDRDVTAGGPQHAGRTLTAIGLSNGMITAVTPLLTRPGLLAGAILVRVLPPFSHDLPIRLDGTTVLVIDGEKDSRRSPGDCLRLAERLIHAGATVTYHVLPVGHSITAMDREIAKEWLVGIATISLPKVNRSNPALTARTKQQPSRIKRWQSRV